MKKLLYVLISSVLLFSCTVSEVPDRKQYIGTYEIYQPSKYILDTISNHKDFSEISDSFSIRYYSLYKKDLKRSNLEIRDDGTFQLRNSLFKDSIGIWKELFSVELGPSLEFVFTNLNSAARLYYDKDGFRILKVHPFLLNDTITFEGRDIQEVKFIYKKKR